MAGNCSESLICILWSAVANVENPFLLQNRYSKCFRNALNHSSNFEAWGFNSEHYHAETWEAGLNVFWSPDLY